MEEKTVLYPISEEKMAFVTALIQSGKYKNINSVLDAALEALEGDEEVKLGRLRDLIDEGLNSGPPESFDVDAFLLELKQESGTE